MYPRLLELPWTIPHFGPITIYTYGVLLAAAYLLGLKLAMIRAKTARPRRDEGARPRHLHHHQRARRREAAAARHRLPDVHEQSARALRSASRGRRVLRRADLAVARRAVVHPPRRLPLWTTCDVFAPGIALGHVVGRFGCFFAGCCCGKPTTVPWAITFTRSVCGGERRDAARTSRSTRRSSTKPARRR